MLDYFLYVNVHKIGVQDGLDNTSDPTVPTNVSIQKVTNNPIENIQATVSSQKEHVGGSNGLCLTLIVEQIHLRENGHRFQIQ